MPVGISVLVLGGKSLVEFVIEKPPVLVVRLELGGII
jgi:hypothetical protein